MNNYHNKKSSSKNSSNDDDSNNETIHKWTIDITIQKRHKDRSVQVLTWSKDSMILSL